jgi:hypothetical protein
MCLIFSYETTALCSDASYIRKCISCLNKYKIEFDVKNRSVNGSERKWYRFVSSPLPALHVKRLRYTHLGLSEVCRVTLKLLAFEALSLAVSPGAVCGAAFYETRYFTFYTYSAMELWSQYRAERRTSIV